MIRVVPDSCCRNSCVLRAMRAEKSVGSARASSSALVCSDWVWPAVAAIASIAVRTTLLNTSCAVSDQPEVWQWVRSDSERGSAGSNRSFLPLQAWIMLAGKGLEMRKSRPGVIVRQKTLVGWKKDRPLGVSEIWTFISNTLPSCEAICRNAIAMEVGSPSVGLPSLMLITIGG